MKSKQNNTELRAIISAAVDALHTTAAVLHLLSDSMTLTTLKEASAASVAHGRDPREDPTGYRLSECRVADDVAERIHELGIQAETMYSAQLLGKDVQQTQFDSLKERGGLLLNHLYVLHDAICESRKDDSTVDALNGMTEIYADACSALMRIKDLEPDPPCEARASAQVNVSA